MEKVKPGQKTTLPSSGTQVGEFDPQHDSFELCPEDLLLANALHSPPYDSPKSNQKHVETLELEAAQSCQARPPSATLSLED